jgi:hypothetical protein
MENTTEADNEQSRKVDGGSILLGSIVRVKRTGPTGVALARSFHKNRCMQYHIQPQGLKDNGEIYDDVITDFQNIELVEGVEQPKTEVIQSIDENHFLGAVVKDKLSPFQGIVAVVIERLYGEPFLLVEGEWKPTTGKIPMEHLPASRAIIIEPAPPRPAPITSQISAARAREREENAQTGCCNIGSVSIDV